MNNIGKIGPFILNVVTWCCGGSILDVFEKFLYPASVFASWKGKGK